MKIDPKHSKERFFSLSTVDGNVYSNCLWRYTSRDNLIYEHAWNENSMNWDITTELTGMIVHGESSLIEISRLRAKELVPGAFSMEEDRHV
jgi:hypothetical protein